MGSAGENWWKTAWRSYRQKLVLRCACCGGNRAQGGWPRLRRRSPGVRLRGSWYCQTDCLEWAILEILGRHSVSGRNAAVTHRVPLGLLLLSRQQLSAAQLRSALERQRMAGEGKIGEWLQRLGFATEQQITAGLARQWSCPVLKTGLEGLGKGRWNPIPGLLLDSFQMIPVEFAEASRTLLIAFSEGLDHTILYAVEQMLGYRTEACFVGRSILQKGLQTLAQRRAAKDVVFERTEDDGECARIIGSYAAKLGAEEVRLAQCGPHLWIRMQGERREAVNLVLRSPASPDYFQSDFSLGLASPGVAPV